MKRGNLLVISGPAGSGKGTVVKELLNRHPDWDYSVSATTRAPRPGEEDGKSYYFITNERFEQLIADGKMAEYTQYSGNYYGTPLAPMQASVENGHTMVVEIEVEGGTNVKKNYPYDTILVMLLPPNAREQEKRLRGRGTEREEDIQRRLQRAHEELDYLSTYDFVVFNEDGGVESCADQIDAIVGIAENRAEKYPNLKNDFFN